MTHRRLVIALACLGLVAVLTGCPPGNRAAGLWQFNLFEDCENGVDAQPGMHLHSNGSAAFYPGGEFSGVWELNGTTISINLVNPSELTFTGHLSNNGNVISDGTYSGDVSGCWDAVRIQI